MVTETLEPRGPASPAVDSMLRWMPQGGRHILVIGDATLAQRHRLISPSNTYVCLEVDDVRSKVAKDDERAFDAVIWSGPVAPDADMLTRLPPLCAEAATMVIGIAPEGPGGDNGAALSVVRARLSNAGWHPLDHVDAGPAADEASAEDEIDRAGTRRRAVLRAIRGPAPHRLTVAALGMKKKAGVTDARIDHPMAALASRPTVRVTWGAGSVDIPRDWPPGLLILHRQFLDSDAFVSALERRIEAGWLIVSEIDDDPRHWPQYGKAGYRAFRGVHAVTVSTPPLARMIRQWTPNVAVLPNGIAALPAQPGGTPKVDDRIRVFFGALNRENDWADIISHIRRSAETLGDRIEFVVVHDRAFFDQLGDVRKAFHPTLALDDYTRQLASCDVSLLPLNDTPFNRLKSDLKFIESCAAGAVPIASPTVYAATPEHRDIGLFADRPEAWGRLLQRLAERPEELADRRRRGRAYVTRQRMHADGAEPRERLYRSWFETRDRLEAQRRARLGL